MNLPTFLIAGFVFCAPSAHARIGSDRDWEKPAIDWVKKELPEYQQYSFFTSSIRSPFRGIRLVKVMLERFPAERTWLVSETEGKYRILHRDTLPEFLKDISAYTPDDPTLQTHPTEKDAAEYIRAVMGVYSPGIHRASCTLEGTEFHCVDQSTIHPTKIEKYRLILNSERKIQNLESP